MKILTLITARGGSKGIPRKNIALVGGKPLLAWTIEAAAASAHSRRIIVSTDDAEIAAVAREYGAEVPFMRPPELARDESTSIEVVEHALAWLAERENERPDYLLLLQPTSPLRATVDIDAAVLLGLEKRPDAVVGVCEASPHPYVTRSITAEGFLRSFVPQPDKPPRRQDYPPAYAVNGAIYLNRCESLLSTRSFLPDRTLPLMMPAERSLDIDGPWDLHVADLVLRHRQFGSTISP